MFSRAWDDLSCQTGYIFSLLADWLHGVLTIYTNYLGGNLVHKHRTIKSDVLGEEPVTKYVQISTYVFPRDAGTGYKFSRLGLVSGDVLSLSGDW